jgi:hypothetical protein
MSAEPRIAGYCRACGKALDEASVRSARGTIYCAEHVPEEPPPMNPAVQTVESAPGSGAESYGTPPDVSSPYTAATPPPIPNPDVSPGLAFLLGLIPGVGAIYNGQYAKGLAHVFIIGVMITVLSNGAAGGLEPLVGLLLPGFWAYMAFEAFHTAQKRRLGQPVDEFSGLAPAGQSSRFPAAGALLIAFGVIFLLNNLEIFELRRALRYWPVLMIGLGVYLLWIRMVGAQKGGRS